MLHPSLAIAVLHVLGWLVSSRLAQDATTVLDRMASAVSKPISYEASWRMALPFGGPQDLLDRWLAASDRIEWFEDPFTGEDLWTLREGVTLVDASREEAAIIFWPTRIHPEMRERTQVVRIFRPDTYIAIMAGTTPARIIQGTGRTAREVLAQRRRGEISAGDTVFDSDFLCFVRRSARLMRDAPDLELLSSEEGIATIASNRLGLTCSVDLETGECIGGTFSTPSGRTSTWEVLDWFPDRMLPSRHPSLVRRRWQGEGREQVSYTIYDSVRRVTDISHALRWQNYRKKGWDRIRDVLVSADGAILDEHVSPDEAATFGFSRRRPATGPMMTVRHWSIALVASGGGLLVVLLIRRWRTG